MRIRLSSLCAILLASSSAAAGADTRRIAIEWRDGQPEGHISITDGSLVNLSVVRAKGTVQEMSRFAAAQDGRFRLELKVRGTETRYGAGTIVTVTTIRNPFAFLLRDVRRDYPIYIPDYGVIVTEAADERTYEQVEADVRARGLQSKLERIESEPEETFENAAANTRSMRCPTWLGLSRDMRIFEVGERLDVIAPKFHGKAVPLPDAENKAARYNFLMGRGWGALDRITRRLEEGVLPILRGTLVDEDITYNLIAFAGLEGRPLTARNLRGTHFLLGPGRLTKEQQAEVARLLPTETNRPEETVLYVRISATNSGPVPRYAFFMNPRPAARYIFDGANGFGLYRQTGRVFVVTRVNGKPLKQEEVAIQLAPGETADFEFYLPHRPIPRERALELLQTNFAERHAETRLFWKKKLAAAAEVRLPERRITEMMRAGLLHLDLITYGLEPDSTLRPSVGMYTAIGSESSPIIQYMDSMGWHSVARRALQFFLDKQHENGFMQNIGTYMLETGAALWSMGEHYRYTRDDDWVRRIAPKLIKSCEYLRLWRQRNMRDDLRGKGFGLLDGQTADPKDPFHSFMLNGYAYLGLQRVSEMLHNIDPVQSERWRKEAEALKGEIRSAMHEVMGKSPVTPLRNGAWCPTLPPWVEYRGPLVLFADGGKWFTHGAMVSRDSLLGPLYLIFQEVVDPMEPAAGFLLNFHNDLMTNRNTAFSQPYYSRHPESHLRRGEVKSFLKAYYNTLASLADRETYTFWEHFFGASPHKTHEEGWFLMDSRWMLYMERGETLDLLPGIPRRYLDHGKQIELKKVASYFGPVSLEVTSRLEQGRIDAVVECASPRRLKAVELRLPHPQGSKAVWVKGGTYNPETERVRIEPFGGKAVVTLGFSGAER